MSDSLVERLRAFGEPVDLRREAADEINRLRSEWSDQREYIQRLEILLNKARTITPAMVERAAKVLYDKLDDGPVAVFPAVKLMAYAEQLADAALKAAWEPKDPPLGMPFPEEEP